MKPRLRIGSGAGYQGDRLEPAWILAERGELDWLGLECLAERTIAAAQLRKRRDPALGYDPLLERRMQMLLPAAKKNGVRLITNMGAANAIAAADVIVDVARRKGLNVKVAALTGDDVLEQIGPRTALLESPRPMAAFGVPLSANAYLGVEQLLPAIESGADVIVTGRVADPSLFLAPIVHRFGWRIDDWQRLGRGTVAGHLLECAGQVSGGYFADPGRKDVPGIAFLGFPYAEVEADGRFVLGKVEGTGGAINLLTAKEQLLYEVMDPARYLTPDVSADFTNVRVREVGPDRVEVTGGTGRERTGTLKVSIGYHAGFLGEGEITYAGANALRRARLAGEIVRERLKDDFPDLRIDLIGHSSLHGEAYTAAHEPYEVRLRAAARARTREQAERIGEDLETLFTNGPAGGGGARKYVVERIGIVSALLDRQLVKPAVTLRDTAKVPAR